MGGVSVCVCMSVFQKCVCMCVCSFIYKLCVHLCSVCPCMSNYV